MESIDLCITTVLNNIYQNQKFGILGKNCYRVEIQLK